MSQPLLSILIPTILDREKEFAVIWHKVKEQMRFSHSICGVNMECRFEIDNKEKTIGEKRELLYQKASGLFSWQIDDDDDISDDAIWTILTNLTFDTDCLTFREKCNINGSVFSSNHSLKYNDWADNQDGFDFVRTPFMKSVIKTEIARSVPIPHIRYGEDHEWARLLKPHLKTEIHIDKELYFYQHNSNPEEHNERYGIK